MADQPLIGLFSETSLNGERDVHQYYRDLGEQIRVADKLGYDFFATTQSYGLDFPDSTFSISPSPLSIFAAQIPLTKRIKALTGITVAPFHHPAISLSEYAAIDVLSEGRAMIGIGRGHPWLYERLGYSQDESRERLTEYCDMIATILKEPRKRHTMVGKFHSIRDFELLPQFVNPEPEVYVAVTTSPQSVFEAADHGFGIIIPSYIGLPIEAVEQAIAGYTDHFQKKWGSRGRYMVGVQLFAGPDRDYARDRGVAALAGQLRVFGRNMVAYADIYGENYAAYADLGQTFMKLADPEYCTRQVDENWPRLLAVWGTAEDCIPKFLEILERLKPHGLILNIDAGGIAQADTLSAMRYAGEHIIPQLRTTMNAFSLAA